MGAPAILDANAQPILSALNTLIRQARNHVQEGFAVVNGGTSQGAGVDTPPDINLNTDAGLLTIAGRGYIVGPGADIDATAGDTVNWGAESGVSFVAAVVRETGVANDTPAWQIIPGAVAATDSEAAPTDAAIDAALGHRNWVRIANVTFTRTGAAAITVALAAESGRTFDGLRSLPNADFAVSDS